MWENLGSLYESQRDINFPLIAFVSLGVSRICSGDIVVPSLTAVFKASMSFVRVLVFRSFSTLNAILVCRVLVFSSSLERSSGLCYVCYVMYCV